MLCKQSTPGFRTRIIVVKSKDTPRGAVTRNAYTLFTLFDTPLVHLRTNTLQAVDTTVSHTEIHALVLIHTKVDVFVIQVSYEQSTPVQIRTRILVHTPLGLRRATGVSRS